MITVERAHWLGITDDPDWQRNSIADPNISLDDTVAAVVSAFPAKPAAVLEIGCGYGRLTREIARWYPDTVVYGLDVNPKVLDEAARHHPEAHFLCADTIRVVGLDVIYSVALFQHLPAGEKQAYIAQAFAALNPGGVLRVQFIEGDHDGFCDHGTTGRQMMRWCKDTGFSATVISRRLVHPQWAWLTAVK